MANDVILDRILGSVIPVLIVVMIGYLYGTFRAHVDFFGLGIEVSRSHRLSSTDDRCPRHHSRVCGSDLANLQAHRYPAQNIDSTHDVYQHWKFSSTSRAVSLR